jgi:hypothetical protein
VRINVGGDPDIAHAIHAIKQAKPARANESVESLIALLAKGRDAAPTPGAKIKPKSSLAPATSEELPGTLNRGAEPGLAPSTKPGPSSPELAAQEPQPQLEKPQSEGLKPPSSNQAKVWVPYAIKQWPQRKDEDPSEYVDRLLTHAPKQWARKTIQNWLSIERKPRC